MRIAIVSDLHSNIEALEVVLADAARKRVQKIYCLGDVVGYGPNPAPVLDAARCFDFVIQGNHDEAVSDKTPELFKPLAAKAVLWTRRRLKPPARRRASAEARARWGFLRGKMKRKFRLGDMLFAHGSPSSNLDYIYEPEEARQVMENHMAPGVKFCFLGHTHIPGIFTWNDGEVEYIPGEPDKRFKLKGKKALINVGSVGQPRDGDPRACYLLLRDDGTFTFRRVPYEVEQTAEKIYNTKGLDQSLGDRLLVGE